MRQLAAIVMTVSRTYRRSLLSTATPPARRLKQSSRSSGREYQPTLAALSPLVTRRRRHPLQRPVLLSECSGTDVQTSESSSSRGDPSTPDCYSIAGKATTCARCTRASFCSAGRAQDHGPRCSPRLPRRTWTDHQAGGDQPAPSSWRPVSRHAPVPGRSECCSSAPVHRRSDVARRRLGRPALADAPDLAAALQVL